MSTRFWFFFSCGKILIIFVFFSSLPHPHSQSFPCSLRKACVLSTHSSWVYCSSQPCCWINSVRWRGSVHLCIYQHSCCWNSTTSVVLAALNVPFLILPPILACIVVLSLIANMNHWPKKTTQTNVYQTSSWKNTFMKIIRFFSYKHHHGYSWLDRKTTIGIKKFLLKVKESGKPEQRTHPWGTNFIIKHRRCFYMHMAYLFITLLDIPLLYFTDTWATWTCTRRKCHDCRILILILID